MIDEAIFVHTPDEDEIIQSLIRGDAETPDELEALLDDLDAAERRWRELGGNDGKTRGELRRIWIHRLRR
jgi:hypothetical protein